MAGKASPRRRSLLRIAPKSLPLEGKGPFAPPVAGEANAPLVQRSKKPSKRMCDGFFGHRKLGSGCEAAG
jgi:hypothetical protein